MVVTFESLIYSLNILVLFKTDDWKLHNFLGIVLLSLVGRSEFNDRNFSKHEGVPIVRFCNSVSNYFRNNDRNKAWNDRVKMLAGFHDENCCGE